MENDYEYKRKKEYRRAIECRDYVEAIIKRLQKRYDKLKEEHELGLEDYSEKLRKLEHEMEILERLKAPQCGIIDDYLREQREKSFENSPEREEELKQQWIKENGELPSYLTGEKDG